MPSRDGGRPIGQWRREGKQSDRFELSRQTGLRRKPKGKKRTPMTRIYISGPISGIDRAVYLSAFAEAERRLRAKGYDTLNPTRLPPSRWLLIYKMLGYRLTLLYDLWHLMRCDGITMLAGWEQSRGARLEKATADIFNIKEIEL